MMIRWMNDYNKRGLFKGDIGVAYSGQAFAVDWIVDVISQHYSLSGVYRVAFVVTFHE